VQHSHREERRRPWSILRAGGAAEPGSCIRVRSADAGNPSSEERGRCEPGYVTEILLNKFYLL